MSPTTVAGLASCRAPRHHHPDPLRVQGQCHEAQKGSSMYGTMVEGVTGAKPAKWGRLGGPNKGTAHTETVRV